MLKFSTISNWLGYSVAGIGFIFGIVILSGMAFQYIPSKIRIMWGIVMILFGVYRFVTTKAKIRQQDRDEET